MLLEQERTEVAETAKRLLDTGLVVNTSGNVSVRVDQRVAITPSGCAYETLTAKDVLVVDLAGEIVDGDLLPSSETPLHLSVYEAKPEARAIVHTHSVYATAVSTLLDELPAIHYQITTLGGPVPVAPYRTFGTPELAEVVTTAMRGRSAMLMRNHGATTIGATAEEALARTITLEWLARVYLIANQAGDPSIIDDDELNRVAEQMKKFSREQRLKREARARG
ncbi:MAG: class II aldolase/adducin family protein [Pseudomonadota bacterium]